MMLVESPLPSAGLAAWVNWANELDSLSDNAAMDDSVQLAKARAKRMINILTQHPQGMSVKDPDFLKTVQNFNK